MYLRKAEEKDFETYKKLYADETYEYQWLYYDEHDEENTEEVPEYMKDCIETIEQGYKNYTLEDFRKELQTDDIYIIEHNSETIGCISICKYRKDTYKILEWALFNPREYETKVKILEALKKLPRIRFLTVSAISKNAINFLGANGFVEKSRYIFTLENSPKRTG